ncbi:unnamed protein product [Sphagnum tenellum]
MAPKKSRNKGTTTPQPDSSKGGGAKSTNSRVSRGRAAAAAAAGAPQVKISSENEVRLRRLLHNTKGGIVSSSSSSSSSAPAAVAGQKEDLTETQKKQAGRRLRSLYDTLVAEGFSSLQIEQALAALPLGVATLEAALDWLCLNLPPSQLPSKFSSGFHTESVEGGVAQLITAARADWKPVEKVSEDDELDAILLESWVPAKLKQVEEVDTQAEQADWIRRYMAQQDEAVDSATRAQSAIGEFHAAKKAAADAKEKGDKQKQASAGRLIRELKEELASLGLSEHEYIMTMPQHQERKSNEDDKRQDDQNTPLDWDDDGNVSSIGEKHEEEMSRGVNEHPMNNSLHMGGDQEVLSSSKSVESVPVIKDEEEEEEEGMLDMFNEEMETDPNLPASVVQMQKWEKVTALGGYGDTSGSSKAPVKKKGSKSLPQRQPKAVLQQHCQKNGWPSPKYERFTGPSSQYYYSVTVVQPSMGRGKSKKLGGPVTCKLPHKEDGFASIAEAQNAVAARALFWLFPELPLYRILPEPYRTMCFQWHAEESKKQEVEEEVNRRSAFVDSLVNPGESPNLAPPTANKVELALPTKNDETKQESSGFEKQKDDRHISRMEAESRHLRHIWEAKLQTYDYQAMLKSRAALPMAAVKDQLLSKIKENEVVVVGGETGCGKTTQVPQYLLDEMIAEGRGGFCNIVCTQPRRIAAISVAERVAVERCEPPPGSTSSSLVGYQVRLDAAWNQSTKLLFCTTGILLRRLAGDRDLSEISHIIVDEVHERTVLGDFLLVILKDLLERRRANGSPPLKLILMSATLDSNLFSSYFGNCPVISAKGRTFPVTTFFLENIYEQLDYRLASDSPAAFFNSSKGHSRKLARNVVDSNRGRQDLVNSGWGDETKLEQELRNPLFDIDLYHSFSEKTRINLERVNEDVIDYELLEDLIIHIDEDCEAGAVLVFLPGMAEIQLMKDRLSASRRFSGSASEWLLPLHSSVASSDQRRVFQRPPSGNRKIVLATNIAETSITIDDVVHVIDCGKHKENRFDPRRGMSSMVEAWISQANARQRGGRAGRVRPGNCFCLYTRHRLETLMRPFQLPEMLRVPLVELCLQIKILRLGSVVSFLERALEPPKVEAVKNAMATLHEVGAVDEEEEITPLGYHLAALPVDVHIAKMMIYGAVFGCISPVLTVAACLSHKSPFFAPEDQRDAAQRAKQALVSEMTKGGANIATAQQSDHLAMTAAYTTWITLATQKGTKAAQQFCQTNFLSIPTLKMLRDMRSQFATLLSDIGFLNFPKVVDSKGRQRDKIEGWMDDLQQPCNINSLHAPIVKAVIGAGLYPNVGAMEEESVRAGHASALGRRAGLASGQRPHWSDGRREVFIHPSSVNHLVTEFRHPFLVFHEKVETSKVYLRDTTVISPYALLLFGGAINVQHQSGRVIVDGWLEMNAPAQTAVLFKELRITLDSVLQERIVMPQGCMSEVAKELIPSITRLLIDEDKPHF